MRQPLRGITSVLPTRGKNRVTIGGFFGVEKERMHSSTRRFRHTTSRYSPLRRLLLRRFTSKGSEVVVALFCLSTAALADPDIDPISLSARYMGTGSCSASNCHGSVNPIKGTTVLQNEYHTWLKHDRHSKAFSALTAADAKRMATHLKIGDPTKEPQCLACHTTYVPDKALRGDRYTVEDGVSCESCHGAAEKWLASHSESAASHARNLSHGLTDTVSLENRATLCLSCHYGDENKRVTHDLYGAGHPRLRFELDTYGILQPKHWIVDEDYKTRKEDYVPLRAWFVGQAVQAESLLQMLRNPHGSDNKSLFPELSLFDCFSCHHNLSQEQWKARSYGGAPGTLQVNLTPLRLLQAGLTSIEPSLAQELSRLSNTVQQEFAYNGAVQAISELSTLIRTRVRPHVTTLASSTATCIGVLKGLSQYSGTTPILKFELAEQVGMGLQAVLATSPDLAARYTPQLKRVFSMIDNPETFSPERFAETLRGVQ